MKRIATAAAIVVLAAAGCGSSSSSKSSSSSTTAAKSSGGDAGAFCSMLAADTEKTASFAASIGTPQQAAKLAEVKADNDAVLADAPSGSLAPKILAGGV